MFVTSNRPGPDWSQAHSLERSRCTRACKLIHQPRKFFEQPLCWPIARQCNRFVAELRQQGSIGGQGISVIHTCIHCVRSNRVGLIEIDIVRCYEPIACAYMIDITAVSSPAMGSSTLQETSWPQHTGALLFIWHYACRPRFTFHWRLIHCHVLQTSCQIGGRFIVRTGVP